MSTLVKIIEAGGPLQISAKDDGYELQLGRPEDEIENKIIMTSADLEEALEVLLQRVELRDDTQCIIINSDGFCIDSQTETGETVLFSGSEIVKVFPYAECTRLIKDTLRYIAAKGMTQWSADYEIKPLAFARNERGQ